ncbi:hypothetical protein PG994_011870 [Apiospora phragmitis]|uniref:Swiss Army Knife RNA repair protein HAD domain-containing protein n=1 Tax=Apiospora phragmitis TaxID=2905665 RepID=A0ABR1TTZ6_9PEZI
MHVSSYRLSFVRDLLQRLMMASRHPNGTQNGPATNTHTVTALSRWSILDKKLPPVEQIKAIHVYDFDNTLFKTPLPNQKLWNGRTTGALGSPDIFINGGWWHDSRILAATGEGVEHEENGDGRDGGTRRLSSWCISA